MAIEQETRGREVWVKIEAKVGDNASKNLGAVAKGLKDVDASGVGAAKSATNVQQSASRMGAAFSSAAGALGASSGALGDAARAATALGAGFNLALGPMGLAVAAAGALGVAMSYGHEKTLKQLEARRQAELDALALAKANDALLAQHFGLWERTLGVKQEDLTATQRAKALAQETVALEEKQIQARADGNVKLRDSLDKTIAANREILHSMEAQVAQERKLNEEAAARKTQDEAQARANILYADVLDAKAEVTANKRDKLSLRYAAVQQRQAILASQEARYTQDVASGRISAWVAMERMLGLQAQSLKLDKQLQDVAAAGAKTKGGGGQTRAQAEKEYADALLRRVRIQNEAGGTGGKLDTAGLERDIAVRDARASIKNKANLAAALLAIDAELAQKKTAILRDDADRSAGLAEAANTATLAREKSRMTTMADRLRANGQEALAIETEQAQAHADYAAEIGKIDAGLTALKRDQMLAGQDLANAEIAADQRRLIAKDALNQAELRAAQAKRQAFAAEVDKFDAVLAGSLATVQQQGGKYGNAIAIAAQSTSKLTKEWKGLSGSGPDLISAVGQVTASIVDGEKTKAAILAVTELAAAAASYPNIPGMVSHSIAATLYGSIAGGFLSTGSGAGASSMGGGTASGYSGGGNTGTGGSTKGGGDTYIIYGLLGSQQTIALQSRKAAASLNGTGFTSAKAA